mgnify:CR=1 FL=1
MRLVRYVVKSSHSYTSILKNQTHKVQLERHVFGYPTKKNPYVVFELEAREVYNHIPQNLRVSTVSLTRTLKNEECRSYDSPCIVTLEPQVLVHALTSLEN